MERTVVMAGFGGQGLLMIGKLLAEACLHEGKEVTWLPSYGPEMRGGTANCTVVVSDRPVGSPIISRPKDAVVMNLPSLDKFGPTLRPGGVLIINSSLIATDSGRTDLDTFRIAANDVATSEGSGRAANMAALGAYVGRTKLADKETVLGAIREVFASKPKFIDVNCRTFLRGYELAAKAEGAAAVG
jgi:2-oxoglutarate ferredoxin oxidoreductase subunit gamma